MWREIPSDPPVELTLSRLIKVKPDKEIIMAIPEFTLRQLLEAGVHFGHQTHRWNPRMEQYIYGSRIIHPLIVGESNVEHNSQINKVFANNFFIDNIDRYPELSYSSVYIIKKN